MRLRLTIQRNDLPDTNILWSVPASSNPLTYTITRLLEDVNLIVPLEAEHWGLEHYVVELGGFECLHFSPVAQTLKEDDHISIRPLVKAEVRARTLTGRHQISSGGQHLFDGIPFGRPLLREPSRPAVRIPPPKRRRLADAGGEMDKAEDLPTDEEMALIMQDVARSEGMDPAVMTALLDSVTTPPSTEEFNATKRQLVDMIGLTRDPPGASGSTSASGWSSKKVQFEQPESERFGRTQLGFGQLDDGEDDDDEDDDNFAPSEDNDEDGERVHPEDSDTILSDLNSELDSDFETNSDSGSSSASHSTSDSGSNDSDDSDSESDSDSDSGESSGPEILSSKGILHNTKPVSVPKSPVHVAPGAGKRTTQSRNARRTMANRLRLLKASGELPKEATLKDLTRYEEEKRHGHAEEEPEPGNAFARHSGKRKRIDDEPTTDSATELERRKQELMAKFATEASSETTQTITAEASSEIIRADQPDQTVSAEAEDAPQEAASEDQLMQDPSSEPQEKTSTEAETISEAKAARRLRPDTSAISRILARQARSVVKKPAKVKTPTPEPDGASDPEFWRTRINLSAFECWEEEFELSAPPFPFKQHWDPAGKLMREKASKKKQKRNKKAAPMEEAVEEGEEEEKIFLNYDDGPDAEINAAIDDQLQQDIVVATHADLPPLPDDISTLPELTSADIKEGAIVVCKFFAVNPITVTPEISGYKTATVEKEGDSGNGAGTIRLRIAERDLPKREKKFDSKGNRVYHAADGFFMGDEEDEGLWDGVFSELLEPKLLQAA